MVEELERAQTEKEFIVDKNERRMSGDRNNCSLKSSNKTATDNTVLHFLLVTSAFSQYPRPSRCIQSQLRTSKNDTVTSKSLFKNIFKLKKLYLVFMYNKTIAWSRCLARPDGGLLPAPWEKKTKSSNCWKIQSILTQIIFSVIKWGGRVCYDPWL